MTERVSYGENSEDDNKTNAQRNDATNSIDNGVVNSEDETDSSGIGDVRHTKTFALGLEYFVEAQRSFT